MSGVFSNDPRGSLPSIPNTHSHSDDDIIALNVFNSSHDTNHSLRDAIIDLYLNVKIRNSDEVLFNK